MSLQFQGITKRYGETVALDALTLLFERARYGERGLPPEAEAEALRLSAAALTQLSARV